MELIRELIVVDITNRRHISRCIGGRRNTTLGALGDFLVVFVAALEAPNEAVVVICRRSHAAIMTTEYFKGNLLAISSLIVVLCLRLSISVCGNVNVRSTHE